jgi:hypothetical protein
MEEPHRFEDRVNQNWRDPADEPLSGFEREITRCLSEELLPQNIKFNPATLKLNPLFKSKVSLFGGNIKEQVKENSNKKNDSSTENKKTKRDSQEESEKLKKFANSIIQKAQNQQTKPQNGQSPNTSVTAAESKPEEESNSDEYVSDDDNDKDIEELLFEREARKQLHSRLSLEPRIFKRIVKSKKPNSRTRDKSLKNEIAKLFGEKTKDGEPQTEDDIFIVLNNGVNPSTDPRELRKAFHQQMMQYLSVRDPSPKTQERLGEIGKRIEVTYKQRKLGI